MGGTVTGFPGWALPLLRCPHCRGTLADVGGGPGAGARPEAGAGDRPDAAAMGRQRTGDPGRAGVIGCPSGHRFDVARQGYLPLLGPRSRTDTGDTAAMVRARQEFLGGGWYGRIAAAVADAVAPAPRGPVVEVGAGTGYYLAAVTGGPGNSESGEDAGARSSAGVPVTDAGAGRRAGLAVDSSRYALRRAARLPGIAAVLADAWSALPVIDGAAAAVLSVFAPRSPAELARILRPGGRVVVVTPAPDHLAEVRRAVPLLAVDEGKSARVAEAFAGLAPPLRLAPCDVRELRYAVRLPRDAVGRLVGMGPTARHLSADAVAEGVSRLPDPLQVTVSVTVTSLCRAP